MSFGGEKRRRRQWGETQTYKHAPGRAQLVVLTGDLLGRVFPISISSTLGREETNDIRLDFPEISRRHAQITFTKEHAWIIEDLGSVNGT